MWLQVKTGARPRIFRAEFAHVLWHAHMLQCVRQFLERRKTLWNPAQQTSGRPLCTSCEMRVNKDRKSCACTQNS